eukprot:5902301-Lingulodinium_polyedra.AAC.1
MPRGDCRSATSRACAMLPLSKQGRATAQQCRTGQGRPLSGSLAQVLRSSGARCCVPAGGSERKRA